MTERFDELSERIARLRSPHPPDGVELEDLDPDPFVQFAGWLTTALQAQPDWPNSMALATADTEGRPSVRTVLLKSVDEKGFVFFTNKGSRKGREMAANPHAALVFYWPVLERQVCVRGRVIDVPDEEADEYFSTRPRGSQLGAWASEQSQPIAERAVLDERLRSFGERFPTEVPRPSYWGGYRLVPTAFEFWKSRNNRLHDRFAYLLENESWTRTRLAP